jgi:hypothetical protein
VSYVLLFVSDNVGDVHWLLMSFLVTQENKGSVGRFHGFLTEIFCFVGLLGFEPTVITCHICSHRDLTWTRIGATTFHKADYSRFCLLFKSETHVPMRNCYRLTIRHGYTDEVIIRDLGMLVFEQTYNCIIREAPEKMRRKVQSPSKATRAALIPPNLHKAVPRTDQASSSFRCLRSS